MLLYALTDLVCPLQASARWGGGGESLLMRSSPMHSLRPERSYVEVSRKICSWREWRAGTVSMSRLAAFASCPAGPTTKVGDLEASSDALPPKHRSVQT